MIKKILVALSIACMVPATVAFSKANKAPRADEMQRADSAMTQLQDVWLTQSQAQRLLVSVETIIKYVKELHEQNKAPRPGAQPCDPDFPGCQLVDLTAVLECLCCIKLQLMCICEEVQSLTDGFGSCCEVIGLCTNPSSCLDSMTDKADIDGLCLSVVSLLKTILLELRGGLGCPVGP